MSGGEVVQDLRCRVLGTVVDGNDFEVGIVECEEGVESGGKFIFFVARGEEERETRTVSVGGGREGLSRGRVAAP